MHSRGPFPNAMFGVNWSPANAAIRITVVHRFLMFLLLFMMLAAQLAHGQSYSVIHDFTAGSDSAFPAYLTMAGAGTLYGTTIDTIFKMSQSGSGWDLSTLYKFHPRPKFS